MEWRCRECVDVSTLTGPDEACKPTGVARARQAAGPFCAYVPTGTYRNLDIGLMNALVLRIMTTPCPEETAAAMKCKRHKAVRVISLDYLGHDLTELVL